MELWRHKSLLVAIDYISRFSLEGWALLPHGIRYFFEVCIDLLCLQTASTLSCGLEECHHTLNKHASTKAHTLHTYCNNRLTLLGLIGLTMRQSSKAVGLIEWWHGPLKAYLWLLLLIKSCKFMAYALNQQAMYYAISPTARNKGLTLKVILTMMSNDQEIILTVIKTLNMEGVKELECKRL